MMTNRKNLLYLNVVNAILFLMMVVMNYLSEAIPLGGLTNKEISDLFPNIFTPAGVTFSIWGVIYGILLIYTIFQFSKKGKIVSGLVGPLYFISSALNIMWIISWHFILPLASFFVILALLITLFLILKNIDDTSELTKLTFGFYTGWILVATIGNIFSALSYDIKGFRGSLLEEMMVIAFIIVAAFIGIYMVGLNKNYYFSLSIIWGITGILIRHFNEFKGEYISILITGLFAIVMLLVSITLKLTEMKNRKIENQAA